MIGGGPLVEGQRSAEELLAGERWLLLEGDCIQLMSAILGGSVHHVITDPPYEAGCHTASRTVNRSDGPRVEPITFPPITEEQRWQAAWHFARLATRWSLIFCQVEGAMLWRDCMLESGARYKRSMVWVKPDGKPQISGDGPAPGYETIVACHGPGGRTVWNGGGRAGVFVHNKNNPASDRSGHQTQKPLPLMRELVRLFTNPGDIVLDAFAGSGSTGVACLQLGRRFIGCELDPAYAAVTRERLAAAAAGVPDLAQARAGQTTLIEGGDL